MYSVSAQGVVGRIINVGYNDNNNNNYYYYSSPPPPLDILTTKVP